MDAGETLEEALVRETEEEIGLPPGTYEIIESRGGYRYEFPERMKKKKKGWFDGQEQTYFLCRLGPDAPAINVEREPREFRDCQWIAPEDFSEKWLPEFKKPVYRAVMRDFFGVELG